MSNAKQYNQALNLSAQAHTDKYNTTKTRVLATGVELSDEAFDALYRAAIGTSGLVGNAPTSLNDAQADALDLIVAFLNANRDEWFTFSDVCGRSGAIKTDTYRVWYGGKTYTTLNDKDARNTLKEFFDRLIKAKVFEVDAIPFQRESAFFYVRFFALLAFIFKLLQHGFTKFQFGFLLDTAKL